MRIFALDRESLLVHVDAQASLRDVEVMLARDALTLDLASSHATSDDTIGHWLESGAEGARNAWLDPADHLLAGFTARIRPHGESFSIKPAPRRAVGPDLLALMLGLHGKMLVFDSVWLRVHHVGVARPNVPFEDDSAEPLAEDEKRLFDAIAREL